MRTLYLNGNKLITVRGDGPSLLINEHQSAYRRIPLRLIGQVIIRGNITIESNVITLLAEHGVPVLFFSSRGKVTATALTLDANNDLIRERVERLSRSAKGTAKVYEWLRAGRRNAERTLVKELMPSKVKDISRHGLREVDYSEIIKDFLSPIGVDGKIDAVASILDGLFYELMLKSITDIGLDPHRGFLSRYQNFAFVKDLCYVLEAERDRQLLQFFMATGGEDLFEMKEGHWAVNCEGMKNIVVRFENHKKHILSSLDLLLSDFFDILREAWI